MQEQPYYPRAALPSVGNDRTLSAMERGFFSHGLTAQVMFSMILQMSSAVEADRLSAAFSALRAMHRILRVEIVDDADMGLRFLESAHPIDVRFVDLPDGIPWSAAVEADLNRWDRLEGDKLFRATVLRVLSGCYVIFTFNHAIADGRSALVLMSDFLHILDGQERARRSTLTDPRDYMMCAREERDRQMLPPLPDFVRAAEVKTSRDIPVSVKFLELDAPLTDRLIELARDYGVTVQGMLIACAVLATANVRREPLRVSTPVDARAALGAPSDVTGVFLALALDALEQREGESFWELAARATTNISRMKDPEGLVRLFGALEAIVPEHADASTAHAVLAPMVLDLMISNLGRVEVTATSARTPVCAIWGPALNTQVASNDVIGVTTYGNQLRLVHTGSGLRPDLLKAMHHVLMQRVHESAQK